MKVLLLFLGFSLVGFSTSSIEMEALNVLYLGLDNPITLSHPKYSCDRLKLVIEPESLATVTPEGCGRYLIKLRKRDRKGLKVSVYKDVVKPRKLLSQETFRTLEVPSPNCSLNGLTGPHISPEQLAAVREVDVDLPAFPYKGIQYRLSAFDYLFKTYKGETLRGTVQNSASFPDEAIQAFTNAKEEDLLIVFSMYAVAPGLGKVPLAGALVFTVKEE